MNKIDLLKSHASNISRIFYGNLIWIRCKTQIIASTTNKIGNNQRNRCSSCNRTAVKSRDAKTDEVSANYTRLNFWETICKRVNFIFQIDYCKYVFNMHATAHLGSARSNWKIATAAQNCSKPKETKKYVDEKKRERERERAHRQRQQQYRNTSVG